jgi:prepilin-type N-terminal cleavage/methylation domain-containing protein
MKKHQSGFTLVEIAIVLVIIGLLLGGVLKGQSMIDSAKVKSLANDFRTTPALLYGYQDKFRAIPGDDAAGLAHVESTLVPTAATAGNGVINGVWNSVTDTDESFVFWNHVRLAGLATGNPLDAALPTNASGGTLGISSTSPITLLVKSTYYVCSGGIDGKLAKQLDTAMDDGIGNTGSMMAATAAVPATAVAIPADGTSHIVCMGI